MPCNCNTLLLLSISMRIIQLDDHDDASTCFLEESCPRFSLFIHVYIYAFCSRVFLPRFRSCAWVRIQNIGSSSGTSIDSQSSALVLAVSGLAIAIGDSTPGVWKKLAGAHVHPTMTAEAGDGQGSGGSSSGSNSINRIEIR